jgi:hypothetical protein
LAYTHFLAPFSFMFIGRSRNVISSDIVKRKPPYPPKGDFYEIYKVKIWISIYEIGNYLLKKYSFGTFFLLPSREVGWGFTHIFPPELLLHLPG